MEETHAPLGTWTETEPDGEPPSLTVHEGGTPRTDSTPSAVPLHRPSDEARQRRADRSPVPVGALALAEVPAVARRDEEKTGPRPTPLPDEVSRQELGKVVPLREAPPQTPAEGPNEANGAERESGRPSAPPVPPVLASDVLREDIAPTEPGRAALRLLCSTLGLTLAIGAPGLGGMGPSMLAIVAMGIAIVVLGVLPLGYAARALGVLCLAGVGMVTATWIRIEAGAPEQAPLLALGVVVLSGGLVFRARYRAAWLARASVALGLGLTVSWFILSGALNGFTHLGLEWQTWLPMAIRVAFALLLLLSLLAFMGPNSTGGTLYWGAGLLIGYTLHLGVATAVRILPTKGPPLVTLPGPSAGMALAMAALAILGAVALAHAMAVASGGTRHRRTGQKAP